MDKIIKFQASWCGPCQALASRLDQVDLGVPVESIDIDEHLEVAVEYGIRSVPTLVYIKQGTVTDKLIGPKSVDEIRQWVDNHQ